MSQSNCHFLLRKRTLKVVVMSLFFGRPFLDTTMLINYQPVSSLPFWGGCFEIVLMDWLHSTLEEVDFLEPFQSGFRPIFGMVTTLVALLDDLDGGKCVPPGLVRSCGSFDTVNHGILLDPHEG